VRDLWWKKWHWKWSFHQRSTLIFIYMLLEPEGRAGEARDIKKTPCFFPEIGEQRIERYEEKVNK
jgi:hypothetical protein